MTTTPGRLIGIIAVLILLVLAAEGGYFWGFNRGLKNAPIPAPTSPVLFSAKDPVDLQAAANAMALLFKPQVIDHLKNVPANAVWWSNWSIGIGGKLLSLNDKTISLELTPDQGVKSWTLPANTHYLIYNETTDQSSDTPKENIQIGDTVSFAVDIDTRTGEILETRLTKSIK